MSYTAVPKPSKGLKSKKQDKPQRVHSKLTKEPKHLNRDELFLKKSLLHFQNRWKEIKFLHTQFISVMSN